MSQAVCNNCWTWYANGETVCPTCRVPLTQADAGAPAFVAGGPPATASSQPSTSGHSAPAPGRASSATPSSLMRLIPIGVVIALVVIAVVFFASLGLGGSFTASDGSFSVKNPGGWYPTTWSFFRGYHVVLSIESVKGGGKSDFAVVDPQQQIPIDQIPQAWQALQDSGQLPSTVQLGGTTELTMGGAPAIAGDFGGELDGTAFEGRVIFVNYNGRTYLVALASNRATWSQMLADFDTITSSWTWLH